jgi:hypothetical protein
MVVGAIIGAISGLAVAIFGIKILSAIPMVAFLGFFTGLGLGRCWPIPSFLWHGYLGLGLSVVMLLIVAIISGRRRTAMGAQLYYAARQGAFVAAIGGVTGIFIVMIGVSSVAFSWT